jgi:hypothetical protein
LCPRNLWECSKSYIRNLDKDLTCLVDAAETRSTVPAR